MRRGLLSQVLAVVCLLAGLSVMAGEGRTPIWQAVTIYAPGKYVVTRDITVSAGTPVIDILASGVDIDLNGYTLTGNGAEVIRSVGQSDIVVRDGSIVGGTDGIAILAGADWISRVVVEDVRIESATGKGIHLERVCDFALRRNIVEYTGDDGIFVDDSWESCMGTIDGNVILRTKRGIVVIAGKPVPILHNRIKDILQTAIYVSDSAAGLIQGNAIADPGVEAGPHHGIHLVNSHGFKIRENTVVQGQPDQGHGIVIDGDDNLVLENVVREFHGDGLRIEGSRNHVEGNILNLNATIGVGWGLHFVAGGSYNTFGRNMARGNGGSAVLCATMGPYAATADFCDEQPGNSSFNDNYMPTYF